MDSCWIWDTLTLTTDQGDGSLTIVCLFLGSATRALLLCRRIFMNCKFLVALMIGRLFWNHLAFICVTCKPMQWGRSCVETSSLVFFEGRMDAALACEAFPSCGSRPRRPQSCLPGSACTAPRPARPCPRAAGRDHSCPSPTHSESLRLSSFIQSG